MNVKPQNKRAEAILHSAFLCYDVCLNSLLPTYVIIMVRLRKILFAIFVILYLVICPSLILYSLGIVIKTGKKNMVKTGVIYIASIPSGAAITLNGKSLNEETPKLIDNLLPGTYTLGLKAENYQPWETIVSVSPEKATPLENILLLPDPLTITELSETPVDKIILVNDNPFLIVSTGSNTTDIFAYIWDEGITQNILPERPDKTPRLKPLFPSSSDQYKGKIIKMYSVSGSPYLIFAIDTGSEKKFLWTDPLFGTSKTEDITDLFPTPPESIEWSENDPRHLLSFQNNAINRIDIATKAVYPKIIDHAVKFTQFGQTIFFLSDDKTLIRTSANTGETNTRLVSVNPFFNDLVMRHFPFEKITAVSESVVLLLGKNGELICNLKPYLLAERDIKGFKWNKKPRKILLWSRNKIGLIDFTKNTDTPFEITWLQDKAKDITNAFWINEGSQVLFADNDQLFLADTGCCGTKDIKEILDIQKQSSIYYSERTGKLFYINKDTGRLTSTELVPQHALLHSVGLNKDTNEIDE